MQQAVDAPEGLRRDRHVDAVHALPWGRRIGLAVLTVFVVAGLFSVFGQRPTTSSASGPGATLSVRVPDRLRGGLVYQGRITVVARRAMAHPQLVLDSGWAEGITLNSLEPDPASQSEARGGRIVLALNAMHAGTAQTVWLQLSVNPTTVGTRSQGVALQDGPVVVTRVHRTLTVFP
jgi:hypothetical protein